MGVSERRVGARAAATTAECRMSQCCGRGPMRTRSFARGVVRNRIRTLNWAPLERAGLSCATPRGVRGVALWMGVQRPRAIGIC